MNRSEMMAAVRSKDTRPEMLVRRLLHAQGYRYRLHRADLPGKPDIVLPSKRKVIFVHGCFWHVHGCSLSHIPRSNAHYWRKLKRNQERDRQHIKAHGPMGEMFVVGMRVKQARAARSPFVQISWIARVNAVRLPLWLCLTVVHPGKFGCALERTLRE